MNEYAKRLLPKVSSWKPLFKKELVKCINWAEPEEWFELRNWCYDNFYEKYPDILDEVYENRSVFGRNKTFERTFATPTITIGKNSVFPQRKVMS